LEPGAIAPQATRTDVGGNPDAPELNKRPDWDDYSFVTLQERLELQRGRDPRITIPTWEEMTTRVPQGLYNPNRPLRIRWSRLVIGRQPLIGSAWIRCLRAFGNEAHQDQVFEESMFWVATRDLRCFYCMGHCEMLMEDGGLSRPEIADRTQRLAEGDWREFSSGERAAFALSSKMTREPWDVSDDEVAALEATLGPERALDALWWIARCQFMTKVSDTFQLQLERENVFMPVDPPVKTPDKPAE
jgi:hypothetical protein